MLLQSHLCFPNLPACDPCAQTAPCRVLAGTSLTAVLATACVSTATFAAAGCIDAPASLLIFPPAVLLAPLGARYTSRLDCNGLKRLLGYFLCVAAPLVPLKAWLFAGREGGEEQAAGQETVAAADEGQAQPSGSSSGGSSGLAARLHSLQMPPPLTAAALVATGGAAGFASGLLGIGGGTIGKPALLQRLAVTLLSS